MHAWNYRCGTRAETQKPFINVMKNPCVKILGHSDNTHYPVNYDALARAARETGTIFEINEASLAPYGYRGDTRENCFEILRCCRKYDLPLLLSSDSHGPEHIGDFTCAAEFVHQAMFPEQLILNNQIPRLKDFSPKPENDLLYLFRQITDIVHSKQNRPVQTQEYTFSCI